MTTPWAVVQAHLERAGLMTPRGSTRRARATRCQRCGAKVLTGMDADVAAFDATVDPTPLSALGEVLAQLEGRYTVALVSRGGHLVLTYRDAGRIEHRPVGADGQDVHAQHRCGSPPLPSESSVHVRAAAPQPEECPY